MKVRTESRICFGLVWYDDEEEAWIEGKKVRERGDTYNGGFFHGMPCGREKAQDYTDETGRRLYAITVR